MVKNEGRNNSHLKGICNSKLLNVIVLIENYLELENIKPSINIELEGVYLDNENLSQNEFYQKANLQLKNLGIKAKLKPEFWHNQWEYESDFQIGNTAQTIDGYKKFLENIDAIFAPQIPKLQPINYDWQKVKDLTIHIPNSTQINISLWNQGLNMLANKNYAFFLQNLLIENSINNLIFFIPNQENLDRLFLKEKYSLQDKLMSPNDISGGNQGSIACYLEKNKKNLPNDFDISADDLNYQILNREHKWQKNARIEFRLASASFEYNLELHILFVMLIVLESVISYQENQNYQATQNSYPIPEKFYHQEEDNVVMRYKNDSFFKNKIALFSKRYPELAGQMELMGKEMDGFVDAEISTQLPS